MFFAKTCGKTVSLSFQCYFQCLARDHWPLPAVLEHRTPLTIQWLPGFEDETTENEDLKSPIRAENTAWDNIRMLTSQARDEGQADYSFLVGGVQCCFSLALIMSHSIISSIYSLPCDVTHHSVFSNFSSWRTKQSMSDSVYQFLSQ